MKLFKTKMAAHVLAVAVLALGTSAAQSVRADWQDEDKDYTGARPAYTKASLQGNYAYVNNSGDVASLGPMTFDGRGGFTAAIKVNLPCADPTPGCARVVRELRGEGTYTVARDGTGVAKIDFTPATNPPTTTYEFVISGTTKKGGKRLATEVFAVSKNGGLGGQIVAPTWSRAGD